MEEAETAISCLEFSCCHYSSGHIGLYSEFVFLVVRKSLLLGTLGAVEERELLLVVPRATQLRSG